MSHDIATDAQRPLESAEHFVNIAAYHFASLDGLEQRQHALKQQCRELGLKGTILLSPEGINLFLAGQRAEIDDLLADLRSDPLLSDLQVKESYSDSQPFERMLVKIKSEIIAFGVNGIDPREYTSKRITADELHQWLGEGRDFVLLDVRNNYEVRVGTFNKAIPVDVDNFRDFPEAVERLPKEMRDRPIVTFCTGGIRCEKAGPFLEQAGFKNVFQLDGGILKYFEEVGGDYYDGECFVFDKRVALDPELKETETTQCYACLAPLTVKDQQSPLYDPPHGCPHCHEDETDAAAKRLRQRQQRLREITSPLPGSVPYENARPLNVPQRFDGLTLIEFLNQYHPHMGDDYWRAECDEGRIHRKYRPVPADRVVREGEQFAHLQLGTIEPDVAAAIEILYEDDEIVVVNKPAPLPLHPSGRFNRNTLQWILNEVYAPLTLKPAHRLDANTTGLVVLSKRRSVARSLQPQFEKGTVRKEYVARVKGHVPWESTVCEASISREPIDCGGRVIDETGLPSRSRFERLHLFDDGTTLVHAIPETGRTNQLRIHLWHLGHPIVGDPLYLMDGKFGETQTLGVGDMMCLHAGRLEFDHPADGGRVIFEARLPEWAVFK